MTDLTMQKQLCEMANKPLLHQYKLINQMDYINLFYDFCEQYNLSGEVRLNRDGVQWFAYDGDKKYGWIFCNDYSYSEMLYCLMIEIKTCLIMKSEQYMSEFAKVFIEKINGEKDKYVVKYPNGEKLSCLSLEAANQRKEEFNIEVVKSLKIGGYKS